MFIPVIHFVCHLYPGGGSIQGACNPYPPQLLCTICQPSIRRSNSPGHRGCEAFPASRTQSVSGWLLLAPLVVPVFSRSVVLLFLSLLSLLPLLPLLLLLSLLLMLSVFPPPLALVCLRCPGLLLLSALLAVPAPLALVCLRCSWLLLLSALLAVPAPLALVCLRFSWLLLLSALLAVLLVFRAPLLLCSLLFFALPFLPSPGVFSRPAGSCHGPG